MEDQIIQLDRQRTLGQMSAALGHELNQPLTAILTNAQIMQRGIRTGRLESTQVEEFLERIIYNTRRTSDIIERIRTYIRPNDVNLISLDLMQVLHDTLALVREDSDRHKVLIKFVRTQHPFNVKGDAIQLSQVLLNVLRNAVEALQHVERREIEIQISTTKDQVTLTITDTGPGLTPRDLETNEMYVNGFSTSLPEEIQIEALQSVPGLNNFMGHNFSVSVVKKAMFCKSTSRRAI